MRVGIIANARKIKDETPIEKLSALLLENGYNLKRFYKDSEISDVDVVIVMGGDGAILHASVMAAQRNIKIIGINYGNLGFLAEYEREKTACVVDLLAALEKNDCRVFKRSILQLSLKGKTYYALNEVSLHRDYAIHSTLNEQILRVVVNIGEEYSEVAGDGLLLSTPTGSTAYSLSAGGAILFPDVPVFMMTQICALALHSRPVVYSNEQSFSARIEKGMALVMIDGKVIDVLTEGEEIFVKKAPFTADFPVSNGNKFFEKIKCKLN